MSAKACPCALSKHYKVSVISYFFDNIGRKLLLAVDDEVLLNEAEERLVLVGVVELDHVLHEVVAVGILDEEPEVLHDVVGQPQLLLRSALFEAALNDAAAVLVPSYLDHIPAAGLEDELRAISSLLHEPALLQVLKLAENGLDDVVGVRIEAQFDGLSFGEGVEQGQELTEKLLGHQRLNQALNCACAVRRLGDLHQARPQHLQDPLPLLTRGNLEYLLRQVVTELIFN